jgi:uncharacterized protein YggE
MKKTVLSVFAVLTLALLLTSCAPTQTATTNAQVRTLNVSGTGTVQLQPDIARVSIGVNTQDPDVAQALNENTSASNAIKQTLLDMGVAEEDIQTSNFNIYPQQQNVVSADGNLTDTQTVFVVQNTVTVIVRQLDSLGDILAAVVDQGANTINGVTFDSEDPSAAYAEARQKAIEDAASQAQAIADAAGVKLGDISSISLGGSSSPVKTAEMAVGAGGGSSVPISGGTLTIQVTANIVYNLK